MSGNNGNHVDTCPVLAVANEHRKEIGERTFTEHCHVFLHTLEIWQEENKVNNSDHISGTLCFTIALCMKLVLDAEEKSGG